MFNTTVRTLTLGALAVTMAMARATTPSDIPEPGSLLLMGTGIAALALVARKRMKK